jgi:hypothetical protein
MKIVIVVHLLSQDKLVVVVRLLWRWVITQDKLVVVVLQGADAEIANEREERGERRRREKQ